MFTVQIHNRRSIRKYHDRLIEKEKIEQLIETILRSPSSRSIRPWELVVVTDRDLIEKLSSAKPHGSSFVKGAGLAIVICADPKKADTWIEDASIATLIAQLTAESMGLGSCWIQIRDRPHNDEQSAEEYVSKLLGLPSNLRILSIAAIGYPAEKKPPYRKEELMFEKVKLNHFDQPYLENK